MADGEPRATLIADHSRHFNKVGCALAALPHTPGYSIGPLPLGFPEPNYHRGSRG
jgi:hypothetical protein